MYEESSGLKTKKIRSLKFHHSKFNLQNVQKIEALLFVLCFRISLQIVAEHTGFFLAGCKMQR